MVPPPVPRSMASKHVYWLMPRIVLHIGLIYAFVLAFGGIYGFFKTRSITGLLRDIIIVTVAYQSSDAGLITGHTVWGLCGVGVSAALSLSLHSREFSKTQDMAPYGHLTALGMIAFLLVVSGLLTMDLESNMGSLVELALYEAVVYGVLLVVGGVIGYKKAQSMPSLVMGSASGLIALIISYYGFSGSDLISLFLLAAEAIILSAFFYTRFQKTKKVMPAGFMFIVSVVSLSIYLIGILVA